MLGDGGGGLVGGGGVVLQQQRWVAANKGRLCVRRPLSVGRHPLTVAPQERPHRTSAPLTCVHMRVHMFFPCAAVAAWAFACKAEAEEEMCALVTQRRGVWKRLVQLQPAVNPPRSHTASHGDGTVPLPLL